MILTNLNFKMSSDKMRTIHNESSEIFLIKNLVYLLNDSTFKGFLRKKIHHILVSTRCDNGNSRIREVNAGIFNKDYKLILLIQRYYK
jgi:hypothetical protein